MKHIYFISVFVLLFPLFVFSGEKPVAAVLDFARSGFSEKESRSVTDLLIFTLMETNRFYVIGRLERNRLLREFDFPAGYVENPENFNDIGKKLYADYIIGGSIEVKKNTYTIRAILYYVIKNETVNEVSFSFSSFNDLIQNVREVKIALLDNIELCEPPEPPGKRFLNSLSPVPVKERVLFILQKDRITPQQAEYKEVLNRVMLSMLDSRRFIPYFIETNYDNKEENPAFIAEQLELKNCHYAVIMYKIDEAFCITAYSRERPGEKLLKISFPMEVENKGEYLMLELEDEIPFLPEETLLSEILKKIAFEEKLKELLFVEKVLSRGFSVTFYQVLFKSARVYYYIPYLTFLSFETNLLWYYVPTIGTGLGYGFCSLYPGIYEKDLSSHPLVHQHEFRIIPFSLRTGGKIGFLLNVVLSLNMHNAYNLDDPDPYTNEKLIMFVKSGINAGITYSINEIFGLYWNGLTFNWAFPVGKHFSYEDDSRWTDTRLFSLDAGGFGIIFRLK